MKRKILLFMIFSLLIGCQRSWQHSLLQGDNTDKTARGKEMMPPTPDVSQPVKASDAKKNRNQ
ncbi:MAG: hypothetical protein H7833_00580 [Magnetococcus sp. DMHC-1]|nr:hypothetical protein [Magnetococcales bacterium]